MRYFVAVAEELNFRRAAERLHLSQPALSKQIKELEFELDSLLLDRGRTHVRLTDAGRVMFHEAREILARVDESVALTRNASNGRSGRLTVGNIAALSTGFMSAALSAFRKRFPLVDVSIVDLNSQEQVLALAAGAIQIGFTIGNAVPVPSYLEHFKLLDTPLRAAVGKTHRIARRPSVSLSDLAAEPLLYLSDGKGSPRHIHLIREVLAARGVRVGATKSVGGFDALVASIASGAGSTLLPELAHSSRTEGIVFKPLRERGADLNLELWVLWHRKDVSKLAQNFADILRNLKHEPGSSRR